MEHLAEVLTLAHQDPPLEIQAALTDQHQLTLLALLLVQQAQLQQVFLLQLK
jgi:hypothetical protein